MAHIKTGSSTKGNRDSRSKRLGVKLYHGQTAKAGSIIVRQKGSKVRAGIGAQTGRDFTIFATTPGNVNFYNRQGKKFVSIVSSQ